MQALYVTTLQLIRSRDGEGKTGVGPTNAEPKTRRFFSTLTLFSFVGFFFKGIKLFYLYQSLPIVVVVVVFFFFFPFKFGPF